LLAHAGWRFRTRARPHEPPTWLASLLPPQLACLGCLGVALPLALGWFEPPPRVHERFDWVAVGTPTSRSLVIHDRRTDWLAPRACLIRPVLGGSDTELLLAELGVTELETIVESASATRAFESDDPRAEQLGRELDRAGIQVRAGNLEHCPLPSKPELRAAMHACQARHGGRGRVTVIAWAGRVRCWVDGRWIGLPELEPEPDKLEPA
jgi:hypothetical protein